VVSIEVEVLLHLIMLREMEEVSKYRVPIGVGMHPKIDGALKSEM
jgi:hypothetical protein